MNEHHYHGAVKTSSHMPALDGMRAVAISLVIALHVAMVSGLQETSWWHLRIMRELGLGVQLFFVVSAFTLTMRGERDARDLGGYAVRRLARIGPAYWLAGFLYGAYQVMTPGTDPVGWIDVVLTAVFGTAWTFKDHPGLVPGGWSVCCEAAFYIALPVCIRIIDGRVWRAVALTVLAVAVSQFRARQAILTDTLVFAFQVHPLQQAPVFMMGVTAATFAKRYRVPDVQGAGLAILLLAIFVAPTLPISEWTLLRTTLFATVASVAVLFAATHPPPPLSGALIRRMGTVSYSMYLVHFALLWPSFYVARALTSSFAVVTPLATFLICTAATFGVSILTYAWIEKPAIDWAGARTKRPVSAPA